MKLKKLVLTIFIIVGILIAFEMYKSSLDNNVLPNDLGGNISLLENNEDLSTTEDDGNHSLQGNENQQNAHIVDIFTFQPLTEEIAERITGLSYKENDVIELEDLVYVQVMYWGFDDKEHVGELIVNEKVANEVIAIFKDLYDAKFPIEKMRLIDEYDADDNLSMADNNTSAFCFREVTGNSKNLSKHSYGIAIDINPVHNPYIKGDTILPSKGTEYVDRENVRKGMIVKGDVVYNAFLNRGWIWGGEWKTLKDYQHFEKVIDLQ